MAFRKSGDTQVFFFNSALASLFFTTTGLELILLSWRSAKGAGLAFHRLEIDYYLDLWIPLAIIGTLEGSVLDFLRA
jgi:hypothetical protein